MLNHPEQRTPYHTRWVPVSILIALVLGLVAMAACTADERVSVPTGTPRVEITVLPAVLSGKLEQVDGCLTVTDDYGDAYRLAWAPNLAAAVEDGTVRVRTGVLAGGTGEVVLTIGERVFLGGGYVPLDEQAKQTLPPNCEGPYFTVHGFAPTPEATRDLTRQPVITATP